MWFKTDTWKLYKLNNLVTSFCYYVTSKDISFSPGAQSDKDWRDDDDGHGAAMLSLKSHVKLMPVMLSNTMSVGKLRSRQPAKRNIEFSTKLHKDLR
jgi:hypothetical protein